MGTAWRPLPLGIDMACMHASWCLLVRCERYEGTFHILLVKLAAKAARAGRTVGAAYDGDRDERDWRSAHMVVVA